MLLSNKDKIRDEISKLDKQYLDDQGLPVDLLFRRKALMAELEFVLRYEEVYWKRNAKYKWIKEGDGNSKFFH